MALRAEARSRLLLARRGPRRPGLRGNTLWRRGRGRRRSRRKADPSYHPQKARVRDDNDRATTKAKGEKQIPHPSKCDGIRNDNKCNNAKSRSLIAPAKGAGSG